MYSNSNFHLYCFKHSFLMKTFSLITLWDLVYDTRIEDFINPDGYDYADAWISPESLDYHSEIASRKSNNIYGKKIKITTEKRK